MASNTKLKRAVRARMAATGERYTTARAWILQELSMSEEGGQTSIVDGAPQVAVYDNQFFGLGCREIPPGEARWFRSSPPGPGEDAGDNPPVLIQCSVKTLVGSSSGPSTDISIEQLVIDGRKIDLRETGLQKWPDISVDEPDISDRLGSEPFGVCIEVLAENQGLAPQAVSLGAVVKEVYAPRPLLTTDTRRAVVAQELWNRAQALTTSLPGPTCRSENEHTALAVDLLFEAAATPHPNPDVLMWLQELNWADAGLRGPPITVGVNAGTRQVVILPTGITQTDVLAALGFQDSEPRTGSQMTCPACGQRPTAINADPAPKGWTSNRCPNGHRWLFEVGPPSEEKLQTLAAFDAYWKSKYGGEKAAAIDLDLDSLAGMAHSIARMALRLGETSSLAAGIEGKPALGGQEQAREVLRWALRSLETADNALENDTPTSS